MYRVRTRDHTIREIADCGNSEALIAQTRTLASGKSGAVASESTQRPLVHVLAQRRTRAAIGMRERLDRIAGVREMPRLARGTGSASARVLFGDCASHGSVIEVVGTDPVFADEGPCGGPWFPHGHIKSCRCDRRRSPRAGAQTHECIGTGLSSFRAYLCCITDEYCGTCWLTRFLGVVVKPKRAKRPLPGSS